MYIAVNHIGPTPLAVTYEDSGSPRIRIESKAAGLYALLSVEEAHELEISLSQALMEAGEAAARKAEGQVTA